MVKFLDDLYLPGPDEPRGVLPWAKSPELAKQDLDAAVVRIGGYRTPNYGQSYLLAANTLLRTAREAGHLDHHGLPIFYLQRHAAELMIKEAILLGMEVKRLMDKLGRRAWGPADEEQRDRAYNEHSLEKLLGDLEELTRELPVGVVPDALRSVVLRIEAVEQKKATWSRYAVSWAGRKNNKQLVKHLPVEVILPLGDLQNLLQAANDALGSIWPFDGRLIGNMGQQWECLAREAGELD